MRVTLQPAHVLVAPADETEEKPWQWLLGEPASTAAGEECWYLLFESGPVVIGVRIEQEADA